MSSGSGEMGTGPSRPPCPVCGHFDTNPACRFCLRAAGIAEVIAPAAGDMERHGQADRLKTLYGITPEDYDRMLEGQGGRCAICRRRPSRRRLSVDHCHKTRRVRGLLCVTCNTTLGRWRDNAERFRRAAEYLDGH